MWVVIFHLLNTGAEGLPLAVVKENSYNFELASIYASEIQDDQIAFADGDERSETVELCREPWVQPASVLPAQLSKTRTTSN